MFKHPVLVIALLVSVSSALAGELIIQGNSNFLQNGANHLLLSGDLTVDSAGAYTGNNQSSLEITDNISINGSGSIAVGNLVLSGNFGEMRANHFHSGLDLKTEQREGLPVYAPADGYVSRINVQHYGYGKALYILHPNGYTTVYGHLRSFAGD